MNSPHIDVYAVPVPGPCSDAVGNDGCEDPVEVEEEEDGEDAAQGHEDEELVIESGARVASCCDASIGVQQRGIHGGWCSGSSAGWQNRRYVI